MKKLIFTTREVQRQVTHTDQILSCTECGHEEREPAPSCYAGWSMMNHYVREHVPRKHVAGLREGKHGPNVEVGMMLGLTGVDDGLVLKPAPVEADAVMAPDAYCGKCVDVFNGAAFQAWRMEHVGDSDSDGLIRP
jgi:hypothetical protein